MPDAESSPSSELAEPILGEPRRYSGRTAAQLAGISLDRARRYWRSFGYATLDDDTVEFTDSDVAVLRMMVGYVDEGILAERDALQLSRLSGQAIARLVQTQVEVVLGRLERIGGATTTLDYLHALAHRVFPDVQLLLGNAWRRHIAASLRRHRDSDHHRTRRHGRQNRGRRSPLRREHPGRRRRPLDHLPPAAHDTATSYRPRHRTRRPASRRRLRHHGEPREQTHHARRTGLGTGLPLGRRNTRRRLPLRPTPTARGPHSRHRSPHPAVADTPHALTRSELDVASTTGVTQATSAPRGKLSFSPPAPSVTQCGGHSDRLLLRSPGLESSFDQRAGRSDEWHRSSRPSGAAR